MVRSAVLYSLALIVTPSVVMGQQSAVTHKWKFPTTINAPWAMEDDQKPLDTPSSAAGLCRSTPFNTTGAYGPLGTNVDAIVGDALNNSGFSNLGCTTAQNETTIAVNPTTSLPGRTTIVSAAISQGSMTPPDGHIIPSTAARHGKMSSCQG